MSVVVNRADVVKLFELANFPMAGKWNKQKTMERLSDLAEVIEEQPEVGDKFDDEIYMKILEAVRTKGIDNIELSQTEDTDLSELTVGSVQSEDDPPEAKPDAEPEADAESEVEVKPKKSRRGKRRAKQAKDDAEKEEEESSKDSSEDEEDDSQEEEKGPRRTRPYVCGEVLRNHGFDENNDVKLTEEIVKEVDKAYGKANTLQTMFTLRNTKKAILGYILAGKQQD